MKAQAADVAVCRLRFYIAPCGHALLQRDAHSYAKVIKLLKTKII